MDEMLARARCQEHRSAGHRRERELTRQVAVARAHRSARWAERLAAYAARRADGRRERADLLASGQR